MAYGVASPWGHAPQHVSGMYPSFDYKQKNNNLLRQNLASYPGSFADGKFVSPLDHQRNSFYTKFGKNVCQSFRKNPKINPSTGRKLKKNGVSYNKLVTKCGTSKKPKKPLKQKKKPKKKEIRITDKHCYNFLTYGMKFNPITGRPIKQNSTLFNKLLMRCQRKNMIDQGTMTQMMKSYNDQGTMSQMNYNNQETMTQMKSYNDQGTMAQMNNSEFIPRNYTVKECNSTRSSIPTIFVGQRPPIPPDLLQPSVSPPSNLLQPSVSPPSNVLQPSVSPCSPLRTRLAMMRQVKLTCVTLDGRLYKVGEYINWKDDYGKVFNMVIRNIGPKIFILGGTDNMVKKPTYGKVVQDNST
jgi:hypothetical protein